MQKVELPAVREREQELRRVVSSSRHEVGIRALLDLAAIERERALREWRRATGDDMVKCQSRYNAMQEIIDFVEQKPREFSKSE